MYLFSLLYFRYVLIFLVFFLFCSLITPLYDSIIRLSLLAIGVFYALPVAQLVSGYLSLYLEGREDVCYYNFACLRAAGSLPPFNNVISNSGYVILGFLFLFIVWRRSYLLRQERRNKMREKLGY